LGVLFALGGVELVESRIITLDRLILINIEVFVVGDHFISTCAPDFKERTRAHQHMD
jgi:hypothetical protein